MQPIILDNIPYEPDLECLAEELRLKPGRSQYARLEQLVEQARAIARPKALYRIAYIEEKGEDSVVVDGIRLHSRILRVNLEQAHRVFAYLATCGVELEDWFKSFNDMLMSYYSERICEQALRTASTVLEEHLQECYQVGPSSSMNPGSLSDWPLQAQRDLFALLGDTQAAIGVQLLDSLLMTPIKTVSGLHFPTDEHFASCQLCPREDCPGRRLPFQPDLYERKYRPQH